MNARYGIIIALFLAAFSAVVYLGFLAGQTAGGGDVAEPGAGGESGAGPADAGIETATVGGDRQAGAGAGAGGASSGLDGLGLETLDTGALGEVTAALESAGLAGGGPDSETAGVADGAGDAPRAAPAPGALDGRPSIDTVRVDPDGSAVVAGRAAPGALVELVIDGEPDQVLSADDRGEFVALIAAPTAPVPTGVRRIDIGARPSTGAPLAMATAPVIVTAPATPAEPPIALRPTPDGIELMQPPPPPQDGVSIDQVSYGEVGDVRVAGRGAPGQVARVYLDNQLEAEAVVGDDGAWRVALSEEIEPALYTLRVDQTSPEGDVTGRAETPFERAPPEDIKLVSGGVVVQPGNNLWRIADFVYGDGRRYTVIYQSNQEQIRDPNLIYPGQIFTLPTVPAQASAEPLSE